MQSSQRLIVHSPPQKVTEAAKDSLQKSPYVSIKAVSCEYDGGILFLRGRLPSYYHKQLAQEAVAKLGEVEQVVNEIEVVSAAT